MAVPLKDSVLAPYSTNFNDLIVASPTLYFITPAQLAAFTPKQAAFAAAYEALITSRLNGTRSEALTADKNSTKLAMLPVLRDLYSTVQANINVSDANKILLGIALRSIPTSIPRPGVRPATDVISVANRTVSVHIHDNASSTKKGKPAGSTAAWVYSFVGETYPSDPAAWSFEGATTGPKFDIQFPNSIAGGTQVWICAAWINAKQEAGPTSVPITTNLQGGGTSSQGNIKIAA